DTIANTVETFGNDFAGRLSQRTFAGPSIFTTVSYNYDDLGNLELQTNNTGTLTQKTRYWSGTRDAAGTSGAAGVHAVVNAGPWYLGAPPPSVPQYEYDLKGNQTTAPGRSVEYTSFNLPKSVMVAGATASFLYDAEHQRAQKSGPNETTYYAGGLFEERVSGANATWVFYVPAGSRVVAQEEWTTTSNALTSQKVVYLHDDHLGSIESISGAQTPVQHLKYDPFGQRVDPATGTVTTSHPLDVTDGFTDQEHDDDLGLINMRGRIYDPTTARFLSVDPLRRGSSQGLNAYSYVGNNPLNYTDPSGFDKFEQGNCANSGGDAPTACPEGWEDGDLMRQGDQNAANNSGGQAACAATPGCIIDPETGLPSITGPLVTVGPKPPQDDDSNGRGPFWGSTREAVDLFSGSGAVYNNRATSMHRWNPYASSRSAARLFGATDEYAFFNEDLQSHSPIAPFLNPNSTVDQLGLAMAGIVFMTVPVASELGAFGEVAVAAEEGLALGTSMCFAAGTRVLMADGSTRPIEEVREGDEVLADDPSDASGPEAHKVTEVHRTATYRLFHVEIGVEDGGGEIVATGSHPFWTQRGWVTTEDLSTNDSLADESRRPVAIRTIAIESRDVRTFNLSVEGVHTFFVVAGSTPVLVHNVDPWDINFTQTSYGPVFTDPRSPWAGRSVGDAIAEARLLEELPPGLDLRAMRMGDGSWAALNNRTLAVARGANLSDVSVTEVGDEAMNEFNAKLSESGLSGPVADAVMRCR
ncbi:MAG TPA: RHS repeat-associated core domain-containing protein, partial [Polyangiaceae bacterium]